MADSEPGDGQPTIKEVQQELDALKKKHTSLETAHEKLKSDHSALKATSSDVTELQKQIERHVTDKSKLLREKEASDNALKEFKEASQKKELTTALTTALGEAGAIRPTTALKLLDQAAVKYDDKGQVVQESISAAIKALQESDPELFGTGGEAPKGDSKPILPGIKPAVDRVTKTAYETEMAAAEAAGDAKKVGEIYDKYYGSKVT